MYLFSCIFSCILASTTSRVAIINGLKAGIDQFSYQVSVQFQGKDECGGGIIGDQFVITAAHCVVDEKGKFYIARINILAGTNDLKRHEEPAIDVDVVKIYIPKEYKAKNIESTGDIAVLKLKHPLGLSHHQHLKALQLPKHEHDNFADKKTIIAGFGWHWITIAGKVEQGGSFDTQLRYSEADVLTNTRCQEDYPRSTISQKELCARVKQPDNEHYGVCTGDSGSPLVYDGKIVVGILSFSPTGCTERDTPAIYTRISYFLNFIHDAMHDKKTKDIRTHDL